MVGVFKAFVHLQTIKLTKCSQYRRQKFEVAKFVANENLSRTRMSEPKSKPRGSVHNPVQKIK
ncbi:hypothetical protein BpHYR1_032237 [Brachionus plicatilis]|uniref:Uncharacterized protein n=1 Tax=Brachionus plicatilis TaxID=10195 RepID=A0A3M7T9E2_BRAPC|nr:hypothetical protein BpHYR1_032237 [Brachionus plicatilis]